MASIFISSLIRTQYFFASHITLDYEELDVDIYILRYPEHTGTPTAYLAIQKPPVQVGEVGRYNELAARSRNDGIDIDHIPSQRALRIFYSLNFKDIDRAEIEASINDGGAIAVPAHAHRAFSQTYGGRNTQQKTSTDATDLNQAIHSILQAYEFFLKELGLTESDLREINENLVKLAPTKENS